LILGSGALKIGEAGEFDYSGSQAIKALKEEGIETILANPNIATVQTSSGFADKVYFLPVNKEFVEKIIEKEKPDGILLGFGGQTALNCGLELNDSGILAKHNVKVLGTGIEAIRKTEDRELFNKELKKIFVKVPKSIAVKTVKEALEAGKKIGFPLIIRAAFALGGKGSGFAKNKKELRATTEQALKASPQLLVEECLKGWKEIEYEVVRDINDNCITVCNMENFDPLGIHTGESIVVAPSQTLSNSEYHLLREIAIKVIRHFGIIGECNIQFALDPKSTDYRVIEVNARLSRSSALASKATGYPLAFVAAKLSLGHNLMKLQNQVTKKTMACFEPALDYIVVKIPRWDLKKFKKVNCLIGTEMKSVGEVMAIGRTFEEAIQKAVRMLNIGMYGLAGNKIEMKKISQKIANPTDERLFAIAEGFRQGMNIEKISSLSKIDKWFLYKIKKIVDSAKEIGNKKIWEMEKETMLKAKQIGFSDKQIAVLTGTEDEMVVREKRKELGITPFVKQIDTLAAEFPAQTNYLYMTYNGIENDIDFKNTKQAIVLGSGAYCIGSSVEFDWCAVTSIKTLKQMGFGTIMVNSNPETVSTDYDACDRLYFEELSLERVLDIYDKEQPEGIIISSGGQIPNNLALKLHKSGAKILGTSPESIDKTENRHKFSALCDSLGIDQPEWKELAKEQEAIEFAKKTGFPVLIRPSYVLSGSAMSVAFNEKDLIAYLKKATDMSPEQPIVISKFIANARELEIDAVAKNGELIVWAISEHVENAGVHSGDATIVLPPQKTYPITTNKVLEITKKIAGELCITGPFNIQFIAKQNEVKVIECNLRASRSFPFVSKVTGTNFIEIATKAIIGEKIVPIEKNNLELKYVGVKAPQFSFGRLKGADPLLGVEMASTGEVACLSTGLEDAFLKSLIATGFSMPSKSILLSISGDENRKDFIEEARILAKKFGLFATEHTRQFLAKNGIASKKVFKSHEKKHPNTVDMCRAGKISLVICIPQELDREQLEKQYALRRAAIDYNVPLVTNKQLAKLLIRSIEKKQGSDFEIKHWEEYVNNSNSKK
jgi:carbamoyl-phosphate synthase large subunit